MPRATTLLLLVLLVSLASPVVAAELVVVWLEDGRMLAGEVDPRTNDERLWLRTTGSSFVVATSTAWDSVKAVNANGEKLSVEAFADRVDEFVQADFPAATLSGIAATTTENAAAPVTRPLPRQNEATRVSSLDVEARVANWDRDPETDGIEIRVFPLNSFGEVIPASGQVTVTLIARNQLPTHDPNAFPQLGRWTVRADTNDFSSSGAVYRLPFRGKHPDGENSLEPHGLVEVSFYVHGQGRFTADAPTYLRRFNPVRRDMTREPRSRNR